ncbi:MAG: ParB/RepB/Spo0J family partition protein [Rhizobiaceae bacterium]|nr:ParB/RepB/Spo0J family partition protein [Rhizobiaceae bacterium]MCV0404658.1 ParB/RepB/Spo0J family partition protein [Rhizobiaceae bacterium]
MSEDLSKRRLGRGLAALIGEIEKPEQAEQPVKSADRLAPVDMISPNPRNPRRSFDVEDLSDLSQSIRAHGMVQPVVVRPGAAKGQYELIAGERRWRAAQAAGVTDIPIIVRDVDDRVALELAIVENVQRADLNPMEEAQGYEQLMRDHNYTQAELGEVIGKSRSHVANTLRLLKLPSEVRTLVSEGHLSAGHARSLVSAADPAKLARRIVEEGLSVRQAEALAQQPAEPVKSAGANAHREKDADTEALERLLSNATGLKIRISHKGEGGELKIAYRRLDQLDELCRKLQA